MVGLVLCLVFFVWVPLPLSLLVTFDLSRIPSVSERAFDSHRVAAPAPNQGGRVRVFLSQRNPARGVETVVRGAGFTNRL